MIPSTPEGRSTHHHHRRGDGRHGNGFSGRRNLAGLLPDLEASALATPQQAPPLAAAAAANRASTSERRPAGATVHLGHDEEFLARLSRIRSDATAYRIGTTKAWGRPSLEHPGSPTIRRAVREAASAEAMAEIANSPSSVAAHARRSGSSRRGSVCLGGAALSPPSRQRSRRGSTATLPGGGGGPGSSPSGPGMVDRPDVLVSPGFNSPGALLLLPSPWPQPHGSTPDSTTATAVSQSRGSRRGSLVAAARSSEGGEGSTLRSPSVGGMVAVLPSEGPGGSRRTRHVIAGTPPNMNATLPPSDRGASALDLPSPSALTPAAPAAAAFGRPGPRRLRRFEAGPEAFRVESVLSGERSFYAALGRRKSAIDAEATMNRFEDLVPPVRHVEDAALREALAAVDPESVQGFAHLEAIELAMRRRIEAVRHAGMVRMERELVDIIDAEVADASAFVGTLEHTLRNSAMSEEERARMAIERAAASGKVLVETRTELAAIGGDESRARRAVVESRQLFSERLMLLVKHLKDRVEFEAELVHRRRLFFRECALVQDMLPIIQERQLWLNEYSDATFYAESYLRCYAGMLDAEAHDFATNVVPADRLERMHFEASEDAGRTAIAAAEAAEFAAGYRVITDAEDAASALRRQYNALSATAGLSWPCFLERVGLSAVEEPSARRTVTDEWWSGVFDIVMHSAEADDRQRCEEAELHDRAFLWNAHVDAVGWQVVAALEQQECAPRHAIENSSAAGFASLLADAFAARAVVVDANDEPSMRQSIIDLEGVTRYDIRVTGLFNIEEETGRLAVIEDEQRDLASPLQAFRRKRMELIADETNDGLAVKVLWHCAEVESDDRQIYERLERRERLALEPLGISMAGRLRLAAETDAEFDLWAKAIAVEMAAGVARATVMEEERDVRTRFLDAIGYASFDPPMAAAIASHDLVPLAISVLWLDMAAMPQELAEPF